MEYKQGSSVPRITNNDHPYMADLYQRSGAGDGSDHQQVLDSAENAWNNSSDISDRVTAAEL
jgi:hypothetical protein